MYLKLIQFSLLIRRLAPRFKETAYCLVSYDCYLTLQFVIYDGISFHMDVNQDSDRLSSILWEPLQLYC